MQSTQANHMHHYWQLVDDYCTTFGGLRLHYALHCMCTVYNLHSPVVLRIAFAYYVGNTGAGQRQNVPTDISCTGQLALCHAGVVRPNAVVCAGWNLWVCREHSKH